MRFYAIDREQMEQQREERLRHQLEIQSAQIEGVFQRHKLPTRVAGGQVGPGWVRFDLQTQLAAAMERIQQIKADLRKVLLAEDIQIESKQDRLQIQVAQPAPEPVNLLDLLAVVPPLPVLTAALGWSDDDRPVMVDLNTAEAAHLLLVGNEGAGKTVLLRSMALSLALHNKPSRLQLVIIDGDAAANPAKANELAPLNYLPHLLTPVIDDWAGATATLQFLVNEIAYRQEQGTTAPAIIVMIDGVDQLLQKDGRERQESMRQLVQQGAAAGIHLILSTHNPGAVYMDTLFKASFPARIVGKVADQATARSASGISDTQAEYLLGQGDFLALAGGTISHFQAAYIGGTDLLQAIEPLYRRQLPVLLAHPTTIRPVLAPVPAANDQPTVRSFVADENDAVSFAQDAADDPDDEISFLDDIE